MLDWSINRRALMGTRYALGLGLLAGALEAVVLASQESLPLNGAQFALLGVANMGIMGLFALLVGGLIALPLHFLLHRTPAHTAVAVHQAVVGFLLIGWYLWQAAWLVYTEERAPGAFALASMPLGFAGVIFFNARFLLRRLGIGKPFGWPWGRVSLAAALALVLLSAGLYHFRDTGGSHALPDDQNLLIISGGPWASAPFMLPGGGFFNNAITPGPTARTGAATLQTGIHPLRNTVLFADDTLPWHYRTLAEVLEAEGYATAAFIGSPTLAAESGLSQGFRVYDDDMSPVLSGLLRLNLPGLLLGELRKPRSHAAIEASFASWLGTKIDQPFYAWVHLEAPTADAVRTLIEHIEPVADETLVIVVGTHGSGAGLSDAAVHVPLAVRAPGTPVRHDSIAAQVRLMDVAATAYTFLGMEGPQTEGVDLAGYLSGERTATLSCTLVGTEAGGPVLGVRNNGMKFLEHADGSVSLFDLDADPSEAHNLAEAHAKTRASAQRLLAPDSIRFEKLMELR